MLALTTLENLLTALQVESMHEVSRSANIVFSFWTGIPHVARQAFAVLFNQSKTMKVSGWLPVSLFALCQPVQWMICSILPPLQAPLSQFFHPSLQFMVVVEHGNKHPDHEAHMEEMGFKSIYLWCKIPGVRQQGACPLFVLCLGDSLPTELPATVVRPVATPAPPRRQRRGPHSLLLLHGHAPCQPYAHYRVACQRCLGHR
jgi:hypothetical protein